MDSSGGSCDQTIFRSNVARTSNTSRVFVGLVREMSHCGVVANPMSTSRAADTYRQLISRNNSGSSNDEISRVPYETIVAINAREGKGDAGDSLRSSEDWLNKSSLELLSYGAPATRHRAVLEYRATHHRLCSSVSHSLIAVLPYRATKKTARRQFQRLKSTIERSSSEHETTRDVQGVSGGGFS